MSISSKDILNEMQFSKHEKECFERLSSILNQQHSIDSQKLDNLSEEYKSSVGRGSCEFSILYDRLNIIEQMIVALVLEHPSFLLDVQAYRLGMLSLGFLRILLNYLVPEQGDENENDNHD